MVSEHNRLGFPSDWLPKTFALATFGNGVLAVAAGIIANLLADPVGSDTHHPVRPFVLAIGVLMATAFLLNKVRLSVWRRVHANIYNFATYHVAAALLVFSQH
jgi:hypothetical protein